jgi:hypothetical protein
VLDAALLTHMGHAALGEKALGAVAMEQAERLRATSTIDLCRAALWMEGRDLPTGRMELVKAALSTLSLPTALGNVANKVLLDNYNETPALWHAFCAIRSTGEFKTNTAIRPTFTGQIEQVPAGGELKHGGGTAIIAAATGGPAAPAAGRSTRVGQRRGIAGRPADSGPTAGDHGAIAFGLSHKENRDNTAISCAAPGPWW